MTIVFVGAGGTLVTPYAKILMLRDNVQHHLQAGRPTPGYPLVHAIADAALEGGFAAATASELWAEVSLALAGIGDLELRELAMSIRTRAVLTGTSSLPVVRGTILLRLSGWKVPVKTDGMRTLGDLFHDLSVGLERVTAAGSGSGVVEVSARPSLRIVQSAGEAT